MVVIKDFEMPKSCLVCPIYDDEWGVCRVLGGCPDDDTARRDPKCPLIEVDLMQMVLDAMEQNNKPLDPEKEKQNKAIAEAILIGDGR